MDFFTPVVDDPYIFGQIAAANALSDVYAMGGKPIMALNIVCFPSDLPVEILSQILSGGRDKANEAGAIIAGGHTVDDKELKYGLSVIGQVEPDKVMRNSGAQPGDVVVLTKPLGIGIMTTGIKADMVSGSDLEKVVSVMTELNRTAAEIAGEVGVNASTDITGFGLLGHAYEMASSSNVTIEFDCKNIPVIEKAIELAKMGIIPAGAYSNRNYLKDFVNIDVEVAEEIRDVLFDPQTSGGLLLSLSEEKKGILLKKLHEKGLTEASAVGKVVEKKDWYLKIK
ncbi:MAG: selenide, water dikinase [Thermosediminibacterales bacterium]|nr:selenide, water dikinase [Thermosediminibacterales bacterium]MDK2835491.1 selenide, water dikinase [Thermosediminibacterales bacterium]